MNELFDICIYALFYVSFEGQKVLVVHLNLHVIFYLQLFSFIWLGLFLSHYNPRSSQWKLLEISGAECFQARYSF